ncbi:hypothetical protein ACJ72_04730 [Emergomyces africanus]|uniref:ZZ-type domain-containing protein n=1 Tax=Emergomyces africanus TaxID=1955775 RepID=A0A1B7NW14_9EURO|nr:hypothetical protein ACJ72_04730 [Emergomyces africanus]
MVNKVSPEKHHDIRCDNCGMTPILGHRFRCINCVDFDLCSSCEELNPHDLNHTFLKIRIPIPAAIKSTFPFIPAPLSEHHLGQSSGSGPNNEINTNSPFTSRQQQQQQPRLFHKLGLLLDTSLDRTLSLPSLQLQLDRPGTPPPSFVDTVNQFGFKLQVLLTAERCSSGVAPANIYRCLMMAAAGSQGTNLEAFAKVLGFDDSKASLAGAVRNIVQLDKCCKTDPSNDSGVELAIGSSAWPGRSIKIKPEWAEKMQRVFEARFAPQEVGAMNAWVSERTQGKIQSVVGAVDISSEDIKLITCLYFKAKWEVPFTRSSTCPGVFSGFAGWGLKVEMRCDMMHRTSDILYLEDDVAQMCVLPYQTGNKKKRSNRPEASSSPFLSAPSAFETSATFTDGNQNSALEPAWNAAIILPKTPGADAILAILTHFSTSPSALRSLFNINPPSNINNHFSSSSSHLKTTYLHLALPRFTLKQSTDISRILFKQGLRPISRPSADFSPMTPSQYAYISKVKHDLFVEVNEEGTEVAAATSMGLFGGTSPHVRVPVQMRVDRPFLFLVFDSRSGSVLCSAVVSDIGGL